ncbi:MAG TPA: Gfo/Idh/MocA family oxidoreductase [Gemmatimonadales bacterium]|nr:Gfo/Idh/MocA family oxidoreductase [Gemmatimonadales bacterium]
MKARLPVGVVGVGALGQHHARHLARLREVQLVGVCDIEPGRAEKIASELGTAAFVEVDDLLARVEAVTVAVPTAAHIEVGLRALESSVPVLMEKPLAATLEEADRLIAAANRRRVQLQVGHIERYNRALRAAVPFLDGPRYIESLRLAPFQPRGTDVAVVLDLMIHDLDLVLHLTGGSAATEVRASGVSLLSPHLDLANARVEFANGAVALATASRVARERIRRLRLFQPNGYFSLDLATGEGEFMRVRTGWQPGTGRELSDVVERIALQAPEADALSLELQSFVHAVRGQREVVVRGEEGRAALALALRVADAVRTQPLAVSTPE